MLPGLNLRYTDPAQRLIVAGWDLDNLPRVSREKAISCAHFPDQARNVFLSVMDLGYNICPTDVSVYCKYYQSPCQLYVSSRLSVCSKNVRRQHFHLLAESNLALTYLDRHQINTSSFQCRTNRPYTLASKKVRRRQATQYARCQGYEGRVSHTKT